METKAAGKSLEDLQKKFPDGKYWNHKTQNGHDIDEQSYYHYGPCNNPDGYTSTPCTDHNRDIRGAGYFDCNYFNGLQCYGFVCKLADDVYGYSNPMTQWKQGSINAAKAGDVIVFNPGTASVHYAMIIERNGTTVTLGECNYDYHCRINWGRQCNVSGMKYIIYSASAELPRRPQGSLMPNGGSRVIPDGDYQIVTGINRSKNLTVASNKTTNGAIVQVWDAIEHEEQTFHVEWLGADKGYKITYKLAEPGSSPVSESNIQLCSVDKIDKDRRNTFDVRYVGNGKYNIIDHATGLRLDLSHGVMTNGANLQLYAPADADNQRWIIKQSGEAYNIISKTSGLYVDIYSGFLQDGQNVQLWAGHGQDNQKWRFIPWDPNPKINASLQASEITYGQALSDSVLTGGSVNTVGNFLWKDSTIRPTCFDSQKTRYKVVFTPSDTVNSVETEITVKVNPSPNTPNMPDSEMKADQEKQTVGDMVLPAGWAWQDGDNAVKLAI